MNEMTVSIEPVATPIYNQWPLSEEDMKNIQARMHELISCICELHLRCQELDEAMPKVEPRSSAILVDLKQKFLLPQSQQLAIRVDQVWRILKCGELLNSTKPDQHILDFIHRVLIPEAMDELTRKIPDFPIRCNSNTDVAIQFIQSNQLIMRGENPGNNERESVAEQIVQLPDWLEEQQFLQYRNEIESITNELQQLSFQQERVNQILTLEDASLFQMSTEHQD